MNSTKHGNNTLPTGVEIYAMINRILHKRLHVRKFTPDWQDTERANVLWVWVMENTDKWKPEKGTFEAWIDSCCRRVIDVYRKEKCRHMHKKKYVYVQPYPEWIGEDGEPVRYENYIPDYRHEDKYDKDTYADVVWAIEQVKARNTTRWGHPKGDIDRSLFILMTICNGYAEDKGIAAEMGITRTCLHSHRKNMKHKIRDVLKERKYEFDK